MINKKKKEAIHLKESEEGYMGGFKVTKGKVEMSLYSNLDMCHDMHMHVHMI